MAFKNTWKSIRLSCFRPENMPLELKTHDSLANSAKRLTLSDMSDLSGSPVSAKDLQSVLVGSNLHMFTLDELKVITNAFSSRNFVGEGGFGPVYKGFIGENIRPGLQAQPVAVKLLDLDGGQGHREWLTEVIFLGKLRHPHLVKLIGYCCEDEQRLLVYEFMARGNLENQLFRSYSVSLPWLTRIKIAVDAAKGLAFLHEGEKPVIYRDFKASNVLLDTDYTAKLSDFGFAKDGPQGDETHVTTRVMGTQGYAAPEYVKTGHLTTMSDVYGFGVVLLELITGKKALDKNRPSREQNLVGWAKHMLKNPHKLERVMDTRLECQYSIEGAKKVAALAYQCLSHDPRSRPTMSHVIKVLESVCDLNDIPIGHFVHIVPTEQGPEEKEKEMNGCEGGIKVAQKRKNGYYRYRKDRKLRNRMRSPAVFSDTALYKTIRKEFESPQQN